MEVVDELLIKNKICYTYLKFEKMYLLTDILKILGYKINSFYSVNTRIPPKYKKKIKNKIYISYVGICWIISTSKLNKYKKYKNIIVEDIYKYFKQIQKQDERIKQLNIELEDIRMHYNEMMYNYYDNQQNIIIENDIIYQSL
ncbi:hypothetical protein AMV259 [Betaentomopoxvirus amoorei]|uniref:AMV259 n=1 Tax=Amsacta moorei entomopoxvirus TaxID=28321 RepID=Q9EME7_AMEPV|nr:hypothetical protein AMV259 [Amsacta moorei entomopoxvirus]AAG02965.1 AMV259 [Amsacta moorei entomopoxvirus]